MKKWWLLVVILAVALIIGWQEKRCQSQAHQCASTYVSQLPSGLTIEQRAFAQQAIAANCEPDSYFCRLFGAANLPNVLLVLVGIGGIYAAIRTLVAVKGQVAEMAAQRVVMSGQLTAMQDQLAQMKSSGEQTERLIEQTTTAAKAAKASADAAVASQRAWVMVTLDKVPVVGDLISCGPSLQDGKVRHTACIRIRCICLNHGRTPAKIIEKRATAVHVSEDYPLPDVPNLDIPIQDPVPYPMQAYPGPGQTKDWLLETEYKISESENEMVSFFVVYGVIKYRHFFSEQIVQTTFGYKIKLDSTLERLIEYPEYNKNT